MSDILVSMADTNEESAELRRQQERAKKARQVQRWAHEVLPSLLRPYLHLLRESESLKNRLRPTEPVCTCGGLAARSLSISCVFFDRLEVLDLKICSCLPAPIQLLSRGLFPCAPQVPTLAVDIPLLQFTRALFVRVPPNTTSFCDTLEAFLESHHYKLRTRESLRRRFGNALLWYSNLVNNVHQFVQRRINQSADTFVCAETEENVERSSGDRSAGSADDDVRERASASTNSDERSAEEHQSRARGASRYLRQRCPLCFGGEYTHRTPNIPDVIVCLDACFTQKRRKGMSGLRDPPRTHPDSVFVSAEKVNAMEEEVDRMRHRGSGRDHQQPPHDGETMEGTLLHLPESVLDGCNDSFVAADERRQKASTQFFADTGLMAMLCRHDRVLWLVNMTSAGEKQHYALSLVQQLFDHLPQDVTVGLLYDIACQLHRSIVKWGFLGPLASRLVFALSVFHAFGHQWPCQVVYHPRKCVGFGLSDGEGCERFWSSIQRLIPSLRVSGYHQRLFVIDTQVKHIEEQSLRRLGRWLRRKWYQCQDKLATARREVEQSGVSSEQLRAEWELQVQAQTKPPPKQSRNRASKTVEAILALQKTQTSYNKSIRELEERLLVGSGDPHEIDLQLSELRPKQLRVSAAIMNKRSALGVGETSQLSRLTKSKFLQLRMNARALKQRIRDRLRQRKFELDRLERAHRQTMNKHKLSTHVESAVKRREPGILNLAKSYNALCKEMSTLIAKRRAPRSAIAPEPIKSDGLFKLDVDDDIWQDVGLEDDDFVANGTDESPDPSAVPRWLGDESVRTGIKAQLVLDRCIEEQDRLSQERCTMQMWMQDEWRSVEHAIANAGEDLDLLYQLQLHQQELCRLCATWQSQVLVIPCAYPMPASWGPSELELNEAALYEISESADMGEHMEQQAPHQDAGDDDGGDFDYGYHDADEADGDLLDAAEAAALTDAYHPSEDDVIVPP
ncbi:uncharacterized protein C8Q71DRAFT_859379 [Rhodofomes roseus]|uniref:CxC1-like cysteine cluster associated with KDZ transposases domain-containing protein n=1 Tax=Rhodofomes roseus TaxID=34475 RepID=A0ABQ8KBX5_9APHY|nr:uncharacterized protein C8Q71DRAFT_863697 [Rhodofomes roseus]XP_047777542.1 uncharacterized protein C8Q71DRAFT_859379 [Rhodofomes roseus]KAH9828839.1 hypothetical protein C8Q71DRAFT_863697 [Rhodofomes roseus]KAH9835056.1 hypothetical protein C8Q71DRAFT_859379 [Rhodofomes roseus]